MLDEQYCVLALILLLPGCRHNVVNVLLTHNDIPYERHHRLNVAPTSNRQIGCPGNGKVFAASDN